jgi:4-amino-4-deoxy-L-arabinose transferase-like glycosyltransferase
MTTTADNAPAAVRPGRGLSAVMDYAAGSHARAVVALLLFCILALLPGFFTIPPIDRDEARFAQATKQMLETGQFVDIRFQDEVRYKKPVGIHWLQAGAVKAGEALGVPSARTKIWLYRIPSLLGAIGAVLLTYWTALAFVTRRSSMLAAGMIAASIIVAVEARFATTDAMLLLTCTAAMGALARIYLGRRRHPDEPVGWRMPALLWTAAAGGVLLKGPLILMFIAATVITLSIADKSWGWAKALRPIPGIAWMLLLVMPWFVAIVIKSGDSFFVQALGHDMLDKVVTAQEAHGAPPGTYLLLFFLTFWPGSVLATPAAPAVWRARREFGARFLLAWLVPSWILFEAALTKLPHYVMPLYPAIAILIAGVMEGGTLARLRWMDRGTVGWFLLPAGIAIAVVVGFVMLDRSLGLLAWPFAAIALILSLFAWWLYEVDGAERSLLRASMAWVFVAITVFAVTFPSLPALFPSEMIAREVRATGCTDPHVASTYAYQEPSLVFLMGTGTRFTDGVGAAEFLRGGACHFALVDPRSERSFVQRADAVGLRYSLLQRIDGYNISIGKPVSLAIFRSAEQ